MDIRTDIFNNVTKFIGDIERAELLSALTLRLAGLVASSIPGSPSLSAFSAARARQRGQTRGYSGYSQPSQRGNSRTNQATARKFCKTCYDSNFGKDVYLSHQVDDSRCPAKISLNQLLAEDKLPIEVQEQLIEENPDGDTSQVVSNTVCTLGCFICDTLQQQKKIPNPACNCWVPSKTIYKRRAQKQV